MEQKKFTQYGKFSILILLPMILLFAGWWIKYRYSEHETIMFPLYISLLLVILLLMFYQLTITIDDKHLSFSMGIGLIRRSFFISDIKACKPVTNYFLIGFGIRLIRNGWLYKVSGFKAVELQFHNKTSVIRIGTDVPEEICSVINQLKGQDLSGEATSIDSKTNLTPRLILMFTIIALFVAFIVSVRQESKVEMNENRIKIKGIYGINIPYTDIREIDTLSRFPGIRMKTNGYADGNTLVGYFKMDDETKAKLFVKTKHSPYLRIISKNQPPVYLNFENPQKTIDLYKNLMKVIKK